MLIAEELAIVRRKYADAHSLTGQAVRRGRARPWIGRVIAFGDAAHEQSVRDVERKDGDAVQALAGRHKAASAEQAGCRLDPDDVVEHGRDTAGTRGIRAEGEADGSGRNGNCRT